MASQEEGTPLFEDVEEVPEEIPEEEKQDPSPKVIKRPSAKTGVKAKASPQPKGKSKAAQKKVMKVLKKPASQKDQEKKKKEQARKKEEEDRKRNEEKKKKEEEEKVMKRPASKKDLWKAGLDKAIEEENKDENQEEGGKEEKEGFENDVVMDEGDEEKSKDRCKNQKFLKLLANKQLPTFIMDEWQRTKDMKVGRTDRQRQIINAIFDRTASGRLMLSLDKPIFNSMKESFSEKSNTNMQKSLPKSLFKGKFNLSEEAFAEGLSNNEFQETEDDEGNKTYTWKVNVNKQKQGDRSAFGYQNQEEGDKSTVQKFEDISKLWKKGLKTKALPSSGSKGQLALCDRETPLSEKQWGQAQGQLSLAQSAFDKQEKDGLKFLQTIGCDNKDDSLYAVLYLGCNV